MEGSGHEVHMIENTDMWKLKDEVENQMDEGWMPVGFTSYSVNEYNEYHRCNMDTTWFVCMMVRTWQNETASDSV